MHLQPPYAIPHRPPPGALAELDTAARALDALSRCGAQLTLDLDEQMRGLVIELDKDAGATALTPTELFALLGFS